MSGSLALINSFFHNSGNFVIISKESPNLEGNAMARHQVCNENEIPVGEKKPFAVDGEEVLVYHLEDGFFATQSHCTHLFWALKNGKIKNKFEVECPFHRACHSN